MAAIVVKHSSGSRAISSKCRPDLFKFKTHKLLDIVSKKPEVDIIIWQHVVDRIVEEQLLRSKPATATACLDDGRVLTEVEKNAVYYAGGFVANKLLKKYLKKHTLHDCLKELVSDDSTETVDVDGASRWLEHVDRGGLCKLSQLGYKLFCAIEEKTYGILDANFKNKSTVTTDEICKLAASDQAVQNLWSVIAFDLIVMDGDSSESPKLLEDIIREWVIMRGHSLRGKYMEEYRRKKKEKDKKKSLRKTLKRKSDD